MAEGLALLDGELGGPLFGWLMKHREHDQPLPDSLAELIVERGLSMSVREIAARAGVNHGLVFQQNDEIVGSGQGRRRTREWHGGRLG